MTYEEAKRICDVMWQMDISCGDIQMVREALEKQTARKPKVEIKRAEKTNFAAGIIKGETYTLEFCPDCGRFLPIQQKYCDGCGKKIDWSNDND